MDGLYEYRILIAGVMSWWIAQTMKLPIHYMVTRHWNWALWFSPGGMPSSHSALVTGMAFSIGLFAGFDTPAFAAALALMMVVVYDAAGVRRQAGMHAQRLNLLINEFFSGQPVSEERLKEVLGHTPRQVLAGILLGIIVPGVFYLVWQ
jgi:acid phosphatase family membrane protein YuiD